MDRNDAHALVDAMHVDLLGERADDLATVESVDALMEHGDCSRILHRILLSDIHLGIVIRTAYRQVLERDPGTTEVDAHAASIRSGSLAPCDVPLVLLERAAELQDIGFESYMGLVYDVAHGREITVAEVEHWAERARERSRRAVTTMIWNATEATKHRLAGIYRSHLWRDPDPAGFDTWATVLRRQGDEPVRAGLVSSLEYLLLARERSTSWATGVGRA